MKKILVLGGGGYVGVELISHLIKKTFMFIVLTNLFIKKILLYKTQRK